MLPGAASYDLNAVTNELMQLTPKLNDYFLDMFDKYVMNDGEQYDVVGEMVKENGESKEGFSIVGILDDDGNPVFTKERLEQNANDVLVMEPVKTVAENEFDEYFNGEDITIDEKVRRFFIESGNDSFFNPELGEIKFANSSVRSERRHGYTKMKIAAYAAMKEVISVGKVIDADFKGVGKPDRYVICAPIKIGNTPYYMGVMVSRDLKSPGILYIHDVITKEKTGDDYTNGSHNGVARASHGLFMTDIIRNALNVKSFLNENSTDDSSISLVSPTTIEESDALADENPQAAAEVFAEQDKESTDTPNGFSIVHADDVRASTLSHFGEHDVDFDRALLESTLEKTDELVEYMKKNFMGKAEKHGAPLLPEEVYKDSLSNNIFSNASYMKDAEPTTECYRQAIFRVMYNSVAEKLGRPLNPKESMIVNQAAIEIGVDAPCIYCYSLLDRKAREGYKLTYLAERDNVMQALEKKFNGARNVLDGLQEKAKTAVKKNKAGDDVEYSAIEFNNPYESMYQDYLARKFDRNGRDENGNKLGARKDTKDQRERFKLWLELFDKHWGTDNMVKASDVAKMSTPQDDEDQYKSFYDQLAGGDADLKERAARDLRTFAQAASQGKIIVPYSAYSNFGSDSILKWRKETIDALNREYGLRWYSHADYHPAFVIDNIQQITDAATLGLKGLMYVKPVEAAKIFAPTGMNINCSCFARYNPETRTYEMDDRLGANWDEVKALRDKYRNVGAVMVVTSDDELIWAAAQDWIDVIIPLHLVRSGNEFVDEFGLSNYSQEQADKLKGKAAQAAYDRYIRSILEEQNMLAEDENGKKTKAYNELKKSRKSIYPVEHQNDYDTYMAAIRERGLTPRFDRLRQAIEAGTVYYGDVQITPQMYMKLVNETRQSESQTQKLRPVFDFAAAKESADKLRDNGYFDYFQTSSEWDGKTMTADDWVDQAVEDIKAGKSPAKLGYGAELATDERGRFIIPKNSKAARKKGVGGRHNTEATDVSGFTRQEFDAIPRSTSEHGFAMVSPGDNSLMEDVLGSSNEYGFELVPPSTDEYLSTKVQNRTMVPYKDLQTKADMKKRKHDEMLARGAYVEIGTDEYEKTKAYFPDLRTVKKKERVPLLKEARKTLETDMRKWLKDILIERGYSPSFDANGDIYVASIYNEFIDHAVPHSKTDKLTQDKTAALYKIEEIFKKAEYLFSSPNDIHGETSRAANAVLWDYFYCPIVDSSGNENGVLISVRHLIDNEKPEEQQAYGWNEKEETKNSLGTAAARPQEVAGGKGSSAVDKNLTDNEPNVKTNNYGNSLVPPTGLTKEQREQMYAWSNERANERVNDAMENTDAKVLANQMYDMRQQSYAKRYNILVTVYDKAGVNELLQRIKMQEQDDGVERIKYDAKKEAAQVTSGRQRTLSADAAPFYEETVAEDNDSVKGNFSLAPPTGLTKEQREQMYAWSNERANERVNDALENTDAKVLANQMYDMRQQSYANRKAEREAVRAVRREDNAKLQDAYRDMKTMARYAAQEQREKDEYKVKRDKLVKATRKNCEELYAWVVAPQQGASVPKPIRETVANALMDIDWGAEDGKVSNKKTRSWEDIVQPEIKGIPSGSEAVNHGCRPWLWHGKRS